MSDWKSDWCTACPIGNPIRRSALLCAVLSRPSCPSSDCVADHMSAGPNQCTKITTILLTMQIDVFIVLLLRPELQHVCTTRIPQDPGQNAQRRCWGGRHSSHELVTLAEGVVKPRASATYLLVGCVLEFKGQLGTASDLRPLREHRPTAVARSVRSAPPRATAQKLQSVWRGVA